MRQICESEDSELCQRILATIATVYEPITLTELTSLVEILEESSDVVESLREIVSICGSFLIVRQDVIYFVHQSAKGYLLTKGFVEKGKSHSKIFSKSLEVMSRTLRRDIYSLGSLGYPIDLVKQPDPDPLKGLRYSCIYWVDHLCDFKFDSHTGQTVDLQDRGTVDVFVREKFLYWLEALSLCKCVPKGVLAMAKFEALVQVSFRTSDAGNI